MWRNADRPPRQVPRPQGGWRQCRNTTYAPLVTVSATYGTGGSVIAPRLAEALGLPFVDRLITPDMSRGGRSPGEQDAGGPSPRSEEGLTEGEQATTPAGRFLSYFARAASVGVVMTPRRRTR